MINNLCSTARTEPADKVLRLISQRISSGPRVGFVRELSRLRRVTPKKPFHGPWFDGIGVADAHDKATFNQGYAYGDRFGDSLWVGSNASAVRTVREMLYINASDDDLARLERGEVEEVTYVTPLRSLLLPVYRLDETLHDLVIKAGIVRFSAESERDSEVRNLTPQVGDLMVAHTTDGYLVFQPDRMETAFCFPPRMNRKTA